MKTTEKQNELIQKYLSGGLNAEELELFMQLKDVPEFKEELLRQARIIDALSTIDEDLVKEDLLRNDSSISDQKMNNESAINPFYKYLWIIILLGLLGAVYWYVSNNNKIITDTSDNLELIAMHNVSYPVQEINRGVDDSIPVSNAMRTYALENYEEALNSLNNISDPSEESTMIKANCFIELGRYDQAIPVLEELTKSDDVSIRQNAEWYLAISQLGNDAPKAARSSLLNISNNENHLFYSRSQKLLLDWNN